MVRGMSEGHIELARAVASIHVGHRFRSDLGDLDELVASIQLLGLLQPITISPDGTLICGVRRYAAAVELGWKTVNVWVRSGISTDLERLLAEQHENTMRKNLTPTEAARLYAELKKLYQEDAARRQLATQFGADSRAALLGATDSVGPHGIARVQAAKAITGKRSEFTFEHVLEVERLAKDPATPDHLRAVAIRELTAMDADGKVHGHFLNVRAAQTTGEPPQLAAELTSATGVRQAAASAPWHLHAVETPEELAKTAKNALARARAARSTARSTGPPALREPPAEVARFSIRAFLMTMNETDYWWLHYDPAEIGTALTAAQWEQFDDWVTHAAAFRDAAHAAVQRSGPVSFSAGGGA
jgi:ParB family chromosome partitioning protein